MALEQITIDGLLSLTPTEDNDRREFSIFAKIVGIDRHRGWCYWVCGMCSKKLDGFPGSFRYRICCKDCVLPIIRYKIHGSVADETGMGTFVIFNEEAEELVGSAASTFAGQLSVDGDYFPEEIFKLIDRSFLFKVLVTCCNLKDGSLDYVVTKIVLAL